MKYLLSLGIVLFSVPLSASEIILEQVTLRRGMEGDTRQSGALDDPKTYSKNKVYREEKALAAKAGIEIDQFLDDYYAKGFRKESGASRAVHYLLFRNSISAPQCKREYLIQRVRQTKIYYRNNRKIADRTVKYLVEVFKLNSCGHTKRADRHRQLHFLGDVQIEKDCRRHRGRLRRGAQRGRWFGLAFRAENPVQRAAGLFQQARPLR
ncbi:hypothetical protein [Mesorhizobium sp. WSM2561]|uniref:hypothetical protein n=1 Tax=Mesorhizobium sp. WSM2561 TaxID=1040985 RepID=UPI0012EBEF26|nr:hypothetical protein [Mesorhizobium sp. WSM2561]